MKTISVGRVEITALTDVEGPFFKLGQIFPGVRAMSSGSLISVVIRGRSLVWRRCMGALARTCCGRRRARCW